MKAAPLLLCALLAGCASLPDSGEIVLPMGTVEYGPDEVELARVDKDRHQTEIAAQERMRLALIQACVLAAMADKAPPLPECQPAATVEQPPSMPEDDETATSPVEDGERDWKAMTRRWEGFEPRLTEKNHIGHGHNCVANGDCARYKDRTITEEEAGLIFDLDWHEAGDRAAKYLKTRAGPVQSACFRDGCSEFQTLDDLLQVIDGRDDIRSEVTAEAIRGIRGE